MRIQRYICLSLSLLLLIAFVSCAKQLDPSPTDDSATLHMNANMRPFASLDDCMENADYVITAVVSEVGEAFALDGARPAETGEDLYDYIRSIRTPVTLSVEEVHYDSTGSLGDSLTVLEYRGTVQGCTLTNSYPVYEENHRYLLFIAIAPDGETNLIIGQASVEIPANDGKNADSFTPLFSNTAFDAYDSLSALTAAVRSYTMPAE